MVVELRSNLARLQQGQWGSIHGILRGAQSGKRLADLGFIPGAQVEMIRPGSTCIVRLQGGSRLALGSGHQLNIELEA